MKNMLVSVVMCGVVMGFKGLVTMNDIHTHTHMSTDTLRSRFPVTHEKPVTKPRHQLT